MADASLAACSMSVSFGTTPHTANNEAKALAMLRPEQTALVFEYAHTADDNTKKNTMLPALMHRLLV